MPTMNRNEVHVCNFPNGHSLSTDCWCEPVIIKWMTNKFGVKVLVVEHNDDTPQHRLVITAERERDINVEYNRNHPDASWITRVLRDIPTEGAQS